MLGIQELKLWIQYRGDLIWLHSIGVTKMNTKCYMLYDLETVDNLCRTEKPKCTDSFSYTANVLMTFEVWPCLYSKQWTKSAPEITVSYIKK